MRRPTGIKEIAGSGDPRSGDISFVDGDLIINYFLRSVEIV